MKQWRWQLSGLMLLAGALVLLLTGCPPRTAQLPEEESPRVAGTQERVTQVNVGMTEYAFTLDPNQAPAGDVVFNVRNTGDVVHAFEIEGQGIEQSTPRMQPGETATLRVENMRPGTYEVYCPVGNHAERGMRTIFTVTKAGQSTGE